MNFSKFNHEKIGYSKSLGTVIQNGYQQSDFKKDEKNIDKK